MRPVEYLNYRTNLAGQKVATPAQGQRSAGQYTIQWDDKDDNELSLASGVYLYRLSTDQNIETRKLLLLR